MAQTDRQTDNFSKATHWKTAVFDVEDNWAKLDAPPPSFIKFVKRKKEVCPTTGKEHFQIHVACNKQVRLTQMCGYIKHTKWFAVLGEQHIKNSLAYIEKVETTAPGAQVETMQGEKYYQLHEIMEMIARYAEPEWPFFKIESDYKTSINNWKWITRRLLHEDRTWANRLSNPTLRRMWEDWGSLFIGNWEEAGSFIIEDPAEGETLVSPEDGGCLIE